jgi:hypothetical protein
MELERAMDALPPPFEDSDQLPAYVRTVRDLRGLPTEHAFHLVKADGHRWLTLKLRSSAAAAALVPYFFGGDPIAGEVTLDRHDTATLREISVIVRSPCMSCAAFLLTIVTQISGRLTWNSVSRSVFLELIKSVWKADEPEPPTSSRLFRTLRQPGQALTGQHSFPFSFDLPDHIERPDAGECDALTQMPASFDEHGARYAVEYTIAVQVRRAGLSADSWCVSSFPLCHSLINDFDAGYSNLSFTAPPYAPTPSPKHGARPTSAEMV